MVEDQELNRQKPDVKIRVTVRKSIFGSGVTHKLEQEFTNGEPVLYSNTIWAKPGKHSLTLLS